MTLRRPVARPFIAALAVLGALLCAPLAAAAPQHTQSASASGVTATFTFRGSPPAVSGAHLKITRDGRTAYDAPVTARLCGRSCDPGALGGRNASSVGIVPLLPGSPQIVLELYSGGANCCFIDQVFRYDPGTMTYVKTERAFPYAGATIKRINGQYRFLSADDNFKYAFTDGADSGEPIQIWRFTTGGFVDVTRHYPGLIRKDAAFWLRLFRHHVSNGLGLIAAWAADQELLGHDRLVQATLKAELARGDLRAPSGGYFAGGAKFVRALNHLLVKLGYKR
ncbi:MAG TPA: hypothetical protein VFN55_02485 [Solirubrobacteraceae bacterium]|nr:hypothetical protein [Solirubrobacteraceae bacterium]